MVRNSVGAGQLGSILNSFSLTFLSVSSSHCVRIFSDCYVADELVVSRAGRRVRVGNTDAEGRMAMVDLLCEMKEKVLLESLLNYFVCSDPFSAPLSPLTLILLFMHRQ